MMLELFKNLLYFGANDTAAPFACVMTWLHQEVFFYLMVMCMFVLMLMVEMMWDFFMKMKLPMNAQEMNFRKDMMQGITYTHSSVLEMVWTLFPSMVLLLMAFPSLDLLYSFDYMMGWNLCLKIMGHQWYWSYEMMGIIEMLN